MRAHEFITEAEHTEIIKDQVGAWTVYIDNHSMVRSMTRGIGPRMMSSLISFIDDIPNLENVVPIGGAFWIQDARTNSSYYFKRLDVPGEPLAVRCETGVKDVPRAGKKTPVFRVNAYPGPESPRDIAIMKHIKHVSRFVSPDVMAANLANKVQKQVAPDTRFITKPATQDSKRYDRAFTQARKMQKELDENFADGKKPGRKGLSRRVGIPKKATLAQLEKIAQSSTGERRRMAQWQLNMRRGRKK